MNRYDIVITCLFVSSFMCSILNVYLSLRILRSSKKPNRQFDELQSNNDVELNLHRRLQDLQNSRFSLRMSGQPFNERNG